jgi:hypothetical protein
VRVKAQDAPDVASLLARPGCEEGCASCWLTCSVVQGAVSDLRAELAAAVRRERIPGASNGSFCIAAQGRA